MIIWGSSGSQIDLGVIEEQDCEVCGENRSFRLNVVYRCFYLYYIFKCVTEKTYGMVCEVCGNRWELDSRAVEQSLIRSPIPAKDRYGLAAFGVTSCAPGFPWWSALGFSWTLDCERVLARGVSR